MQLLITSRNLQLAQAGIGASFAGLPSPAMWLSSDEPDPIEPREVMMYRKIFLCPVH